MPRNNKNLVAKDIDGKKIREQYFDGLLIGVFIFAICYIIWCLFNIKNFQNNFMNMVIVVTCFSPFILLAIGGIFLLYINIIDKPVSKVKMKRVCLFYTPN